MSYVSAKRSESSASRRSIDGDTTEEGDRDESKRKSRNLSEKKRRDQFNILINELSTMVSATPRKMDKSTVLKATISFLKTHNELSAQVQESEENAWKPSFLSNEEFTYLMLEALDGFIMVVSSSGRIIYVSESVTSLLGHLPADLVGNQIYDFILKRDRRPLFNVLNNNGSQQQEKSSKAFSAVQLNMRIGGLEVSEENFKYHLVKLSGYLKKCISADCENDDYDVNDKKGDEDRRVYVCTGRLIDCDLLREMSVVVDSSNTDFSSRYSLEWKFLFLDHRAPPIIGYLPFEVLGTSGYDYYHVDDLDKVSICHETLMQKGEGTSCYYRFLTKGQQWIWLQTRYYITYHQWNSKPEFIVGTHRVVSYADVMKELRGEVSPPSPRLNDPSIAKQPRNETRAKKIIPKGISKHKTPGFGVVFSKRLSSDNKPEISYKFNSSFPIPLPHKKQGRGGERHPPIGIQHHQPMTALNPPLPSFVPVPPVPPLPFHFTPMATLPPPPSLSILPPPQLLQEELLIKHAELQRHILQQQEELRRVSEQILMTQCGLISESTLEPPSQEHPIHSYGAPLLNYQPSALAFSTENEQVIGQNSHIGGGNI